ncbi:hypothetical protein EDC94DRAFT_604113 [Helicostylum pulchrum]|nr:hypothetical protein EDC94DRAFT_604113 [Helicostylum pulchrum]
MEVPSENTAEIPTQVATPAFQFSPIQQWEIAFIYAFSCTFNPQQEITPSYYKLPDFMPEELEQEIQKQESDLIRNIICASLGNLLNRKNPIESFKISLCQTVNDKMKAFEIDLETNPLSKSEFNSLDTDVKLYLLRSLVEWQLQDSLAVKSILEYHNSNTSRDQINPVRAIPIGVDSKKRNYWQFGDSCWIWREKPHFKLNCEWETVCRDRQDLERLVKDLSSSNNRAEKALIKVITEEIYEIAEKEERKKLRKERAELRKLIPVEVSITPTTLRSRGNRSERVRYNYDEVYEEEDEEEDFESEGAEEDDDDFEEDQPEVRRSSRKTAASPPIEKPTRWSNRLNRSSTLNELEDMTIDSQKVETDVEDMDTARSATTDMDVVSYDSPMETSDSQSLSVMDISRPDSIIAMDTSRSQSVME